jgi:ADP-ribosylation factor-like protein 5B
LLALRVGLDNAGKTTTLYKLCLGEVVCTVPTVGANTEEFTYRSVTFTLWDLGGQGTLRAAWPTYFAASDAVVVVVDATDRQRIGTLRTEMARLLASEDLASAPVLVYANKQDLADAMSAEELSDALGLNLIRNHAYHVQASCALTGEGLLEGMSWLVGQVTASRGTGAGPAGRVT